MLSWRVLILPYLGEMTLYRRFNLDEPWDSNHNRQLLKSMPAVFLLPNHMADKDRTSTYYRVFVGPGTMFGWQKSVPLQKVSEADGVSNTLMIVEAADAVPWTKPDELEYDNTMRPRLGFHFDNLCNVVFGDGTPRSLKKTIRDRTLHALIQYNDGQAFSGDDIVP
jgi:hypothetical protein